MLKFFRTIRRCLLESGKVRSYAVYAIGEIVLVVIGILIALQVNNWNEGRKNIQKSHEILREIKRNIVENINLTKEKMQDENDVIKSVDIILNNLNHTKIYHDSLDYHFLRSHIWPTVTIKSSGYETLKANGIDMLSSGIAFHSKTTVMTIPKFFSPKFP